MDGLSVAQAYEEAIRTSRELVDAYQSACVEAAEAETAYQKAKALAVVRLKAQGVPATLIAQQVKGDTTVADALYRRELSHGLSKVAYERILIEKKDIERLRDMLAREWAEAKYEPY